MTVSCLSTDATTAWPMAARVEYGWALSSGVYAGMAMRVRTERYELMGASRRAKRLAVAAGECSSGLRSARVSRQRDSYRVSTLHPRCRKLVDLAVSKRQDLIDILEPVGVAAQRQVGQGHQQGSDVLDGQIRARLRRQRTASRQRHARAVVQTSPP